MKYRYGMLLRPFSIGAQPKGVVNVELACKAINGYWDILVYDRKLSDAEINQYELETIQ